MLRLNWLLLKLIKNGIEIHQALLLQFSLQAEFLIVKVQVKDQNNRVLMLVNLTPVHQSTLQLYFGLSS
jgi:hypothetical protein